ncbi:uncharacterized protein LOC142162893 [Nicotiana tabacum]|uniref:Uncharacterized protein LOC142162893 n=1 Tax=Nicotiana tabacum TaxID=4097 RepID=A0AC58RTL7_TOBAC
MPDLIGNCQIAFVPGRMITDNIIMSHELVKGYGRKNISPRCMLKIDMQKVYDSVEWITEATEGEQGVQISPKNFQTFSAASELIANPYKSYIHFGGVDNMTHQHIMDMLGYTKGELPFRYLGVSLSTKRLIAMQCEPLIDRMLSRMLDNKVFVICRRFLWSGSVEPTKKALIAWDKLCAPKNTEPKSALWVIQKNFKAKRHFEDVGYKEEEVTKIEKFSVKHMYKAVQEEFQKVS